MSNGIKPTSSQDFSPQVSSSNEAEAAVTTQGQTSQTTGSITDQNSEKTNDSLKKGAADRAAFKSFEELMRSKKINDEFENPALNEIFQVSKMEAQPYKKIANKPPSHAKGLSDSVKNSKGFDDQFKPTSKPQTEALNQAVKDVKDTMKSVDQLMVEGKYGDAKKQLEDLMKKQYKYEGGVFTGEHAMRTMKGVGQDSIDTTNSLISQLGYVDKMQKAGIQAQVPPTEQQMKDYFATFKTSPSAQKTADAKQAFRDYVDAFHIHIVKSTGDATKDIVYSPDNPKVGRDYNTANSWKEVTTDRTVDTNGKHAGKYVNDCEGYAYLSETLFGAAGFKVKGYVSGVQDDNLAHIMVLLEDPQGKPAVTSNEGVYDHSNVKVSGKKPNEQTVELLEAGWGGAGARGIPNFYIGGSSAESQSHLSRKVKEHELK
jgi:hypothetical protein